MPQMSPLNWIELASFFIVILLMINSLNYFAFLYKTPTLTQTGHRIPQINWKW